MSTENLAVISLVIAGFTLVFTALGTLFNYLQIRNLKPFQKLLLKIKKYDRIIMIVTIILLSGVLIWQLNIGHATTKISPNPNQSRSPLLVFAGGGSVPNMIKNVTNNSIDIKDYDKSIYLDLPSTNAWPLLTEEVMINHTLDSVTNKFYPICLSALKASSSVFHKIVDSNEFMKKGTILSYKLGKDILKVYTNEDIGEGSEISIDELSGKIKEWCINKSVDIFITQEGSGTYSTYQNLLKNNIDINTCKDALKWYDTKLKFSNLPKHFIILTSTYYTPKDIADNCNGKRVMGYNKNGREPLSKEMYLYFAGYRKEEDYNKDNSGKTYIVIPEEMVEFLKKLKKNNTIIPIKSKMYQREQRIITPLDTLLLWEKENNNN